MNLYRLIQNENMKLYGRKNSRFLLGIVFCAVWVIGCMFYGLGMISRNYWDAAGSLLGHSTQVFYLILIVMTSQIVSGEFSWGTAKLLFIRPISRSGILLSKYMTSLLYALTVMAVWIAASLSASGVLTGGSGFNDPAGVKHCLYLILIKATGALIFTSISFAAALWSRSYTIPIIIGIAMTGTGITDLPILPNTSFFVSNMIWFLLTAPVFVYAWIHFHKSDL
ncbi:ABC transporter permease [Paenibacillus sp. J2TS4]|uniref:ABC transporter permease n=1 Tax=Paenibacillus sp. J2TS4 TaxID=2807194 RepID=UPI001B1597ED|nr:ABC transporter permease [Paenibacillus sp. J2TS4]GIP33826.1 hypothetical protein J2TS4_30360 [Paenibacillus sp. J2TS4]